MKLLLATDAWYPQVNGVVRTMSRVVEELKALGNEVEVVATGDYPSIPLPYYPEIRISIWLRDLAGRIDSFCPDAIHISTEGPIGYFVRRYCLRRDFKFTSALHTRFPEYIRERLPIPLAATYRFIRQFHSRAFRTLVPTQSLKDDLKKRGFDHLQVWGRGVDTELFSPTRRHQLELPKPIYLNVGRVAPEKNLERFLDLELPGTKIVVGGGPQLRQLRSRYPEVVFTGVKYGEELAGYYASSDVFVFPSLTDTFGLVLLESLSSGTPVAAYPVTGPRDVLRPNVTGVMCEDLKVAIEQALKLDREICRQQVLHLDWGSIAKQFLLALVPLNSEKDHALKEAQWQSQVIPA